MEKKLIGKIVCIKHPPPPEETTCYIMMFTTRVLDEDGDRLLVEGPSLGAPREPTWVPRSWMAWTLN
jgi:hypothetical protein